MTSISVYNNGSLGDFHIMKYLSDALQNQVTDQFVL